MYWLHLPYFKAGGTSMRIKELVAVSALSILFISGCSDNASGEATAKDGQSLYEKSCLSCHGADLKGGAAPSVVNMAGMAGKYTEKEVLDMINNGIGLMPGGLVTEEEAQVLTEWLMEQ
jgi:cytochrome c551